MFDLQKTLFIGLLTTLLVLPGNASASVAAALIETEDQHRSCQTLQHFQEVRNAAPTVKALNERPAASGFIDSEIVPIRVHYQEGVSLDYATAILADAEISYGVLFYEVGMWPPHPDGDLGGNERFDFYIVTDLLEGVGGYTGFSGFYDATERADAVGYVVVADDIDSRLRRGVVAHELTHASQIGYDWWEHLSFMEGHAVWASSRVFPDENMVWRYFTFFNAEPQRALNYVSITSPFQYGTGMWVTYLEERYGDGKGVFLTEVWERSVQNSYENEPDYFDAIDVLLRRDHDTTFLESYAEFGAWRTFVESRDDGAHFQEAHKWIGWSRPLSPYFVLSANPSVSRVSGVTVFEVQQFGHALFSFDRHGVQTNNLRYDLNFDKENRYAVYTYARAGEGRWTAASRTQTTGAQVSGAVTFDAPVDEIVVVVTNLGEEDFDPDLANWIGINVRYEFSMDRD